MSHRVDAIRRERLIEILKNKGSRTAQDISLLMDVVGQNKLFATLTEYAQKEICKNMTYLFVKRDRILLREGDESNHYYMILRGCVGVYKLDPKQQQAIKKGNVPGFYESWTET